MTQDNAQAQGQTQGQTQTAGPVAATASESQPAESILQDVCVVENGATDAPTMIARPPVGETQEIKLQPGQDYVFAFEKSEAVSFVEQDGDLVITFDCNGKLVLKNYSEATTGTDASSFAFSSVIPQGELASLIKLVEAPKTEDEPQAELRKSSKSAANDQQGDVANIEPAAGDTPKQSTAKVEPQNLAAIEPAAGAQGPAGGSQNSGYGFNSSFSATPVGPLNAVGPIDPTALRYNANFPEPQPFIEAAAADPDTNPAIGPDEHVLDETNLSGGPLSVSDTINVDFGADGPGAITPDGTFTSGGSMAGGVLTSHGVNVIVTPTANGYEGKAGATTVFTLVIDPSTGNYTFTQFLPFDHQDGLDPNDLITLKFGVLATDADGDSVSTSLTIGILDDAPSVVAPAAETIDEDLLSGGPVVISDVLTFSFGQDAGGAVTPNGTSSASGHLAGGVLSSAGVPVLITPTANGYEGKAGATTVFTLVINPATGAYDFTLFKPLDHSVGGDTITLDFGIKVADYDTDKVETVLHVNIIDDVPHFVPGAPVIGKGFEIVDETNLGPIVVHGDLPEDFGSDGPGGVTPNGTFTSSIPLTSHSVPVIVTPTANGYEGKAGATTIFTVTVNPATGGYTFTLLGVLDHPDATNPDDIIALNFGIKATDSDGDVANTTLTVQVKDDGPTLAGDGTKSVSETTLPGATSVNGDLVENFGKDGGGNIHPTGTSNATGHLAGGILSSGGIPVLITPTANGYEGKAGATTVFTVTINPTTGAYTFTLLKSLDHSVGGDTITLTFGAEIVDYDGDKAQANIVINVSDDRPTIGDRPDIGHGIETVDETNLGPITVNGTLNHDFGSDTPGVISTDGAFSSSGSKLGGNLTSHGVPVNVTSTATGYEGKAGGVTVFTITINPNTGAYEFRLFEPLDHNDGTQANDSIALSFGVKITDSDGDTDTGTIVVNVLDDAPTASDDGNFTDGSAVITGNVTDNDDVGEDIDGTVTAILFNGVTTPVPTVGTVNIVGNFGTLTIDAHGQYSYMANGGGDGTDVFRYTLRDYDGDTAQANLTIRVDQDDTPQLVKPADEIVDETNLGPIVELGTIVADFGSDTPGAITPDGTFTSSIPLTSHSVPVIVTPTANGYEGKAGATTIFTVTVNPATGGYTFTLLGVLDHPDATNPDDIIALNFGIKATDSDGDVANTTLTVQVKDDGPTLAGDGTKSVSETTLPGATSVNGDLVENFGKDGGGNIHPTGTSNATGHLAGGILSSGGIPVLITPTANGYEGKAGATTVFTVTINPTTGAYTFTLLKSLDHSVGGDTITLTFGAEIVDYDGDKAQANIVINVTDDRPTIGDRPDIGHGIETVDETNLGPITVNGSVNHDYGSDGAGSITPTGVFTPGGSMTAGNLTSHGVAVVVTPTANGYEGKAGATTIFTLTINPNTGAYEFKLLGVLDHQDVNDPNDVVTLNFGVKITDSDGDTATGSIRINVLDDAPVAHDDHNLHDGVATGNVISGLNGGPGAADDLSNDTSNTVTKISFGGTTVDVPAIGQATINGDHGVLKISADGSYTYTPKTKTGGLGVAGSGSDEVQDGIEKLGIRFSDSTKAVLVVSGLGPDSANAGIDFRIFMNGSNIPIHVEINVGPTPPADGTMTITFNAADFGGGVLTGVDLLSYVNSALPSTGVTLSNITLYRGADVYLQLNPTESDTIGHQDSIFKNNIYVSTQGEDITWIRERVCCGEDEFVYTLKDGDGDTSTAKLTLECKPDVAVDISVNNGAGKICVPEDSQGTVPVSAAYTGGDGDEIMTLKVTGVDNTWTVTAPGWTNNGGGVYTLVLPAGQTVYTGNFTFKPPANSDVDMTGLNFTASVFDPDTGNTKTDSQAFTVQVDAVVDTPTLTATGDAVYDWNMWGPQTAALNIQSSVTDLDGSEIITKIVIDMNRPFTNPAGGYTTLESMGVSLNKGVETSPGIWEIAVNAQNASAAVSGLQMLIPAGGPHWGPIHQGNAGAHDTIIKITAFVEEHTLSGGECDLSNNNTQVEINHRFTFKLTPLVIDIDGDGIELVGREAGVHFDMTNDGVTDSTSWVKGDDGFLAIDRNGDGLINDQTELFGNTGTADDGFANLAQYDINADGVIDGHDAVFNDLRIWQDVNQDGVSQPDELLGLADLGIASINLHATDTGYAHGDSWISHEGTFNFEDGRVGQIVDAWFEVLPGANVLDTPADNVQDSIDLFVYGLTGPTTISSVDPDAPQAGFSVFDGALAIEKLNNGETVI